MSDKSASGSYRDKTYWLVYLYRYEPEEPMGFLWAPVGIVENRQTWQNWWKRVQTGEIELPGAYGHEGWWVSDRPITFGLFEAEDARTLRYGDTEAEQ